MVEIALVPSRAGRGVLTIGLANEMPLTVCFLYKGVKPFTKSQMKVGQGLKKVVHKRLGDI